MSGPTRPDPVPSEAELDALLSWFLRDGRAEIVDESGRALGEHTHLAREDVDPAELAPPRFGDVRDRFGLPYNRAAFAQVGRHWRWVLPALWHLAAERGHAGRDASAYEAHGVALDAFHLPVMRALREGVERSRPSERYAGLHKIALGYTILFGECLLDGVMTAAGPADPWQGDELLRFLDDGAWLVGRHECCAGPLDMIRAGFDALARPRAPEEAAAGALPPGDAQAVRAFTEHARTLFALSVVAVSGARVFLQWGADWGEDGAAPDADAPQPLLATLTRPTACRAAIWSYKHPQTDPRQALRLFPEGAAPAPLRDFVAELEGIECPLDLDRRFLAHARPVAARLLG